MTERICLKYFLSLFLNLKKFFCFVNVMHFYYIINSFKSMNFISSHLCSSSSTNKLYLKNIFSYSVSFEEFFRNNITECYVKLPFHVRISSYISNSWHTRVILITQDTNNIYVIIGKDWIGLLEKSSYSQEKKFSSLTYDVVRLLHHGRLRRIHNGADATTRDCVLATSYSHPRPKDIVPGETR